MPHQNERKLIPLGKSSLAIILPRQWLDYYKLAAKDKLVVISNGNVTIEAPKKNKSA